MVQLVKSLLFHYEDQVKYPQLMMRKSWAWWCTLEFLALGRRQELTLWSREFSSAGEF